MRCQSSTNKKTVGNSNRKKPPLMKASGISNASKLLRYPSNSSNLRNNSVSVKSNHSAHQVILPNKLNKRLNSNKTLDANTENNSVCRIG